MLDNMYAYSSFPLLKKAALVAMVSRAESDTHFQSSIRKFVSLESSTCTLTAGDLYRALEVEMVDDMQEEAQRLLFSQKGRSSKGRKALRVRPRPLEGLSAHDVHEMQLATQGLDSFKQHLFSKCEELVNRVDVASDNEVSYSEWLAATA